MTIKQDEFDYRGVNSRDDLELIVGHVSMPIAPTISESVNDIPMKYGNEFLGTAYGSKSIDIPVTALPGGNHDRYMQIIENLTSVFVDNDPDDIGLEFPLILGFHPNVTYYGHFTAIPTPTFLNENSFDFTTTLTFVMSDPRGCLPQLEVSKLSGSQPNGINVSGTANAEPVIHIIPKHDLFNFGYSLNGGLFGVGPDSSEELDQGVVAQTNKVMADDASTLAMWSRDPDAVSTMHTNVPVKYQGTLMSNATTNSIFVKKDKDGIPMYGDVVKDSWYGPAGRHAGLSESLSDFKVTVRLHHKKYTGKSNGRAMGRVEAFLLDADGQNIGRFCITDHSKGSAPVCYVQICRPGTTFKGGDGKHHSFDIAANTLVNKKNETFEITMSTKKVKYKAKKKGKGKNAKTKVVTKSKTKKTSAKLLNKNETNVYSHFWGEFMLEKQGNVWHYSVQKMNVDTGKATAGKGNFYVGGKWIDKENTYTDLKLGSVGFSLLKYPLSEDLAKPVVKYKDPYLSFSDVKVWKMNDVDETKPQVVAYAGDEIIINTESETVTVDNKLVYPVWSTNWPRLKPGSNYLQFSGDLADADISMEYLPRIK